MLVGIFGAPNKGKTSLFNALTHGNALIASYPFTTIDPNKGVAFVSRPCPCTSLKVKCTPKNSKCENGVRKIPLNIIDVAGLVPEAHEGKGMGNQFLNDLSAADALICIADASGTTDEQGNPTDPSTYNPVHDIDFIEKELNYWLFDVIKRNLQKTKRKELSDLAQLLSGIKVSEEKLRKAISNAGIGEEFSKWTDEQILKLANEIRSKTKPMVIALNKIDLKTSKPNIEKIRKAFPNYFTVPISADAELALQKARERKLIAYFGKDFEVIQKEVPEKLLNALASIKKNVLQEYGSTGAQEALDKVVFELLECIVVYPVEDETHFTDHFGNILPDAILLPKGSKALDLAQKIHSDLAKGFLYAVNARTKMRVGREEELKDGDVIKVVSTR